MKKRILVVDDESSIRQIIFDMLSLEGKYRIATAIDGIDALSKMDDFCPDVVLLDLNMPNMGGIEFLKAIGLNRASQTAVIIMTGLTSNDEVKICYKLGIANYLHKPLNFFELAAAVSNALEHKEYVKDLLEEISRQKQIIAAFEKQLATLAQRTNFYTIEKELGQELYYILAHKNDTQNYLYNALALCADALMAENAYLFKFGPINYYKNKENGLTQEELSILIRELKQNRGKTSIVQTPYASWMTFVFLDGEEALAMEFSALQKAEDSYPILELFAWGLSASVAD